MTKRKPSWNDFAPSPNPNTPSEATSIETPHEYNPQDDVEYTPQSTPTSTNPPYTPSSSPEPIIETKTPDPRAEEQQQPSNPPCSRRRRIGRRWTWTIITIASIAMVIMIASQKIILRDMYKVRTVRFAPQPTPHYLCGRKGEEDSPRMKIYREQLMMMHEQEMHMRPLKIEDEMDRAAMKARIEQKKLNIWKEQEMVKMKKAQEMKIRIIKLEGEQQLAKLRMEQERFGKEREQERIKVGKELKKLQKELKKIVKEQRKFMKRAQKEKRAEQKKKSGPGKAGPRPIRNPGMGKYGCWR